jgi:hypothetical protein
MFYKDHIMQIILSWSLIPGQIEFSACWFVVEGGKLEKDPWSNGENQQNILPTWHWVRESNPGQWWEVSLPHIVCHSCFLKYMYSGGTNTAGGHIVDKQMLHLALFYEPIKISVCYISQWLTLHAVWALLCFNSLI